MHQSYLAVTKNCCNTRGADHMQHDVLSRPVYDVCIPDVTMLSSVVYIQHQN